MRTLNLSFVLCTALLAVSIPLSAQEISCDVPLVVTRFAPGSGEIELVTDLVPNDFSVTVGGSPAKVKSAAVDAGGKRVAIILDASRKVSKDEWKFETQMALSLVEKGRSLDKFSLSLIGVQKPASPFVAPADLLAQLRDMAASRPEASDDNERTYDSLFDAARRIAPPEFGDTIFLFGHPDDSGSQASLEQVEEVILRNRLRFCALSFTDPLAGKLPRNFDLNKPLPKSAIPGGADDISHATGYFFSYHSVRSLQFSGQPELLEGFLKDEYTGIAKPYRLDIVPSPSARAHLEVKIRNAEARNIRQGNVHFPGLIYPCTSK